MIAVALFAVAVMGFYSLQTQSLEEIERRTRTSALLAEASRAVLSLPFAVLSILEFDDSTEAGRQAPVLFLDAGRQAHSGLVAAARYAPEGAPEIEAFRRRLDALMDKVHAPLAIGNATPGMTRGDELRANELAALASGARLAADPSLDLEALSRDIAVYSDRLVGENLAAAQWLASRSGAAAVLLAAAGWTAFFAVWAAARRGMLRDLVGRRAARREARIFELGLDAGQGPGLPLDPARRLTDEEGGAESTLAFLSQPPTLSPKPNSLHDPQAWMHVTAPGFGSRDDG